MKKIESFKDLDNQKEAKAHISILVNYMLNPKEFSDTFLDNIMRVKKSGITSVKEYVNHRRKESNEVTYKEEEEFYCSTFAKAMGKTNYNRFIRSNAEVIVERVKATKREEAKSHNQKVLKTIAHRN